MWKQIEGYENYEVSEEGQVRNIKTGLILKQDYSSKYIRVKIFNNNGGYRASVHRLIAQAFIPNPENKPIIDHIDRCITNNNISNLRWVTYSENSRNTITTINAKNITYNNDGYCVNLRYNCQRYRKWFKKLEDAEAYLEELKSTIIINGFE